MFKNVIDPWLTEIVEAENHNVNRFRFPKDEERLHQVNMTGQIKCPTFFPTKTHELIVNKTKKF